MRTMYLDISAPRIVVTRLLGKIWPGAYYAATAPLHLANLPEPPLPAADWVRVGNRMCGICGSDLHQMFVDAGLDVAPVALPSHKRIYLGHEMVGEVIEVGPAVNNFTVGRRVVRWGRGDDCRARGREPLCPACRRGHRVLCEAASDPPQHRPVGGGFGDTFITPASTLLPVPQGLHDAQAIFVEPTAVAIHAAWRRPPQADEQVLVYGCGTIAYLLMQVLKIVAPACRITAVAQFPWQAELAGRLGADHVILSAEDGYAAASRITGARCFRGRGDNQMLLGGFDLTFDVVGIPATLEQALRWTRAGGAVVLVGVHLHKMRLDLTPVWYQEVDLLGAVGHDVVTWQGETLGTFELAMRWLGTGQVVSQPLLTHTFPLDQYKAAFATAVDKQKSRAIKVAFEMTPRV